MPTKTISSILMVPIRIDALHLTNETMAVEPVCDFSRIPYRSNQQDINSDLPPISEEIVSLPYENQSFPLSPGLHLHWILPAALNKSVGINVIYRRAIAKILGENEANHIWEALIVAQWIKPIGNGLARNLLHENQSIKPLDASLQPLLTKIDFLLNSKGNTNFPNVPNRWLVTRRRKNNLEKQWIVESDFLHPAGKIINTTRVTIPYLQDKEQPYRYLGRQIQLQGKYQEAKQGDYWGDNLTAIGYGEPTFAAFYPNCHSVFGCYDADIKEENPKDLTYDVIGWYSQRSDENNDYLTAFIQNLIDSGKIEQAGDKTTGIKKEISDAIEKEFNWHIIEQTDADCMQNLNLVCHGRINIQTEKQSTKSFSQNSLTVANTGTEALGTVLTDKILKEKKLNDANQNIQQLKTQYQQSTASVMFAPYLESRKVDIAAKLNEITHESGFRSVAGGSLWSIRAEKDAAITAADAALAVNLSESFAEQLDSLNQYQQNYDKACYEIDSLRQQLYADWYKYALCSYPPVGNYEDYINSDEVKTFIEAKGLAALEKAKKRTGQLLIKRDAQDQISEVTADASSTDYSLAANTAKRFNILFSALQDFNVNQYLLTKEEVSDWNVFCKKMQTVTIITVQEIFKALPTNIQNLIKEAEKKPITAEIQDQILAAINKLLITNLAFNNEALIKLPLPESAKAIQQISVENRSKKQMLQLNRWILEACFPTIISKRPPVNYRLIPIAAPRYWEANEPVVYIDGEIAEVTDRFDHKRLACHLLKNVSITDLIQTNFAAIFTQIEKQKEFNTWKANLWQPFILEWDVSFYSLKDKNYWTTQDQNYHPDFITHSYDLSDNACDLTPKKDENIFSATGDTYIGSSLLTPYAQELYTHKLAEFIKQSLLTLSQSNEQTNLTNSTVARWLKNIPIQINELSASLSAAMLNEFLKWYNHKDNPLLDEQDPISIALQLWKALKTTGPEVKGFKKLLHKLKDQPQEESKPQGLSQVLSGFHAALLMRKITRQLQIMDPLADDYYQQFAAEMNAAVQQQNHYAPAPHNAFNPIRAGLLKLQRLRLVDVFGQVKPLDVNKASISDQMHSVEENRIGLPVRIAQPARLNFRWLAASNKLTETNNLAVSNPICGWLVPNNLEQSLMFYNQAGKALGYIDQECDWRSAPEGVGLSGIENSHLTKVIDYLLNQDKDFLAQLLRGINDSLEKIEPEKNTHAEALSFLMGRPIAIVRAGLSLDLKDLPAIDQDWNIFRSDMSQTQRETHGFCDVQFPVRVGDYQQLNDGLIGYWKETVSGYENDIFYINAHKKALLQESTQTEHVKLKSCLNDATNILQSFNDPTQKLTLLIDPRGKLQATCGILPAKAIDIPQEQFMSALHNIEVSFLTAPIITANNKIKLPLADEAGFQWSWVESENGQWQEISRSKLEIASTQADFAVDQVIREGWLKLKQE